MITGLLLVAARLPMVVVALIVAAAGARWIALGQRRGWLLVAAAALRLLGTFGAAVFVALTWFGLGDTFVATLAVSTVEGTVSAAAWALLLIGLLLPPGPPRDLDRPLD